MDYYKFITPSFLSYLSMILYLRDEEKLPNGIKHDNEFDEDEELIYFENLSPVCFACYHKIESKSEFCPYCGTRQ